PCLFVCKTLYRRHRLARTRARPCGIREWSSRFRLSRGTPSHRTRRWWTQSTSGSVGSRGQAAASVGHYFRKPPGRETRPRLSAILQRCPALLSALTALFQAPLLRDFAHGSLVMIPEMIQSGFLSESALH